MRFLVDENLPRDIADLLAAEGADVLYVAETALAGSSDDALNALAVRDQRIIVTRDLDFPLATEQAPPGVLLMRVPDTYRRHQIRELFEGFVGKIGLDALTGRVTVIAPGREPRSRSLLEE